MKRSNSFLSGSLLASLLFHALVGGLLLWAGLNSQQPVKEVPLALELWSSAPPPPPAVAEPAPTVKPVQAAPVVTPPAPPPEPPAEVNMGAKKKPEPKPPHEVKPPPERVSKPVPVQKLLPEKPKPEPVKKVDAPKKPEPPKKQDKPVEKPVSKSATPAVADKKAAKTPPPALPGKGSKQARSYNNEADDLLSSLDSPNTTHKANARSTQAGSANGMAGGSVNGSAAAKGGWIDKVKAKVTPLVQIPPDVSGNPKVVLLVTLLPTLEVSKVQQISSSGNKAYDDAVQRAIWEARTFPSLPAGANFNDGYRQFKMEFRPRS
jgi:colicin import membrane protein